MKSLLHRIVNEPRPLLLLVLCAGAHITRAVLHAPGAQALEQALAPVHPRQQEQP